MTTGSCPSESVLAHYADRELPAAESRAVEAHLAGCRRCPPLVEALLGEVRLLTRVLEEAGEAVPAGRNVWADLVTTGLCLLGAAAGFQSLFRWLDEMGQQAPMSVDTRSFAVSVLFSTFFYLVREGASMLTPLLSTIGFVAVVLLSGFLALSLRRRSTAGPFLVLAALGLADPAHALERRTAGASHDEIVVAAGQTVDDSLFAVGETVSIDGVVTGNVIALAHRVIVRGTVKGDLVTGAQRVDVAGTVEGNVFSASQSLVVRGPVGRSLHAFAEHLALEREGRVEGDVFGFTAGMDLEGRVGRDLFAFGGFTNLKGEVGRNASAWTDRLRVLGPAKIGGDLTAHARKKEDVTMDAQATVGGKTETRINASHRTSRYARASFYVWRVIWLTAAFLTGLLLHRLFPTLFAARLDALSISTTLGVGFVALVAAPVAILLLALTMVGLPLAFLALALWGAGVYLSWIFVGVIVGRTLLARPEGASFAIALLVGLAFVTVIVHLPYVGWLLSPFVTLLGLGIGVVQAGRAWRQTRTA
jgi:cytoskeletal protein CcmA (bactofilin family)